MKGSLLASYEVIQKNEVRISSVDLVDMINKFRIEEGNDNIKQHNTLMRDIRKEIEDLKNAGFEGQYNFVQSSYINSQNKEQPCYSLNRDAALQILNKESAVVRAKTIQYINILENKLQQPVKPLSPMELLELQFKAIKEQEHKIEEVKNEFEDFKGDIPLFQVECKELQTLVRKIGTKALGGYKTPAYNDNSLRGKVYSDIQNQIKREFDVNRYEAIKRCQFDSAMEIVSNYRLPYALEQDIKLKNMQLHLVADNVRQITFN